ncbi:MAG: 50S ribosomal protein L11 methyltransferase [Caulobacterales bacterium]|nr:50S ribosomal protein L11 methyltransferase [Caulobacterales bacterium]MCA0372663.1 50S ribosomal protein L11 methyltransferase [Pseudomonadota bacterium]
MLDANGLKGPIEEAAQILENLGGFGAIAWFETERRQFRLEAYGEDEDVMQSGVAALALMMPELATKYALLPQSDWIKMSLEGLPPVDAGRFRILGSHDKSKIKKGKIEIIIDAGEAFGTGHHGTTRGCLLALERLIRNGKTPKNVLDVGTGSGVLAIAAAKMGAKCIGTEIDARAAEVARENLHVNKVNPNVKIYVANGIRRTTIRKDAGYDLVFANILMKPLIKLSRDLSQSVAFGGHLVLSGLLTTQEPAIKRAFSQQGLVLVNTYHQDVWSTLTYKRVKN